MFHTREGGSLLCLHRRILDVHLDKASCMLIAFELMDMDLKQHLEALRATGVRGMEPTPTQVQG